MDARASRPRLRLSRDTRPHPAAVGASARGDGSVARALRHHLGDVRPSGVVAAIGLRERHAADRSLRSLHAVVGRNYQSHRSRREAELCRAPTRHRGRPLDPHRPDKARRGTDASRDDEALQAARAKSRAGSAARSKSSSRGCCASCCCRSRAKKPSEREAQPKAARRAERGQTNPDSRFRGNSSGSTRSMPAPADAAAACCARSSFAIFARLTRSTLPEPSIGSFSMKMTSAGIISSETWRVRAKAMNSWRVALLLLV